MSNEKVAILLRTKVVLGERNLGDDGRGADVLSLCTWPFGGVGWGKKGIIGPWGHSRECTHRSLAVFRFTAFVLLKYLRYVSATE